MIFDSTRHDTHAAHPDVHESASGITVLHDDGVSGLVLVSYTAPATASRPAVSWVGMTTRASAYPPAAGAVTRDDGRLPRNRPERSVRRLRRAG